MADEANAKPARGRGKRAAVGTGAGAGARQGRAGGGGKAARAGRAETSVSDLLYSVSRVSSSFEALLKASTPALTLSQWALLETLSKDGEATRPSQVSRRLGASRQSIRQSNKKLTKLGLLETLPAAEGKKAVGLRLTDAGRAKLDEVAALTGTMAEAVGAGRQSASLTGAMRSLRGLSQAITAQTPKPAKKVRATKSPEAQEGEVAPSETVEA
jgi:DNA-binding MarR family transcriptional regulator